MNVLNWITKRLIGIIIIQLLSFFFYFNVIGLYTYSKERVFSNGERKIILLGMFHTGTKEYYNEISKRYINEEIFVLREGIRSEGDLEIDHSYAANMVLLEYQKKDLFLSYNGINSDLHYKDMDEKIMDYLGNVFDGVRHIALLEREELEKKRKKLEENKWDMFYSLFIEGMDEIVYKRNKEIFKNIEMTIF